MTTAAESHDAQLAAIKTRHEAVREQIANLDIGVGASVRLSDGMSITQTGLTEVMVDRHGRFWAHDPNGNGDIVMLLDPMVLFRTSNPDDTQAAQGFKAHEELLTPETLKREINMVAKPGQRWSCTDVQFFDHQRRAEATITQGERSVVVAYSARKTMYPIDVADIVENICGMADEWATKAA